MIETKDFSNLPAREAQQVPVEKSPSKKLEIKIRRMEKLETPAGSYNNRSYGYFVFTS
ncbi:MAG: hypothetical protein HY692_06445 [Cyanobacteria bacterium NC_groundwater_1444_Ag_S-0.65um_54_12]|nr:hypothetical protein [Cyanobacteria bacterium NC_groundwater_1444_Ag_S-0.65um_54_12]